MNELLIILKTRWWLLRNKAFAVKRESSLKISIILLFIVGYAVGSFLGLWHGFDYIANNMGLGYFLIDRLFYMFFFVLLNLLIVSQIIITYSTFYRNLEVKHLFSLPVSYPTVFGVKFLEATFLSSWAFIFLVVPLLLAYGVSRSLGFSFYFLGIGLAIPFIFIAAALGTIIGMMLVKFFSKRFTKIIIIVIIIAAAFGYLYYQQVNQTLSWQTADFGLLLDRVFQHTRISMNPFLPSVWITKGLLTLNQNDFGDYVFNLLLLLSTALFFVWIAFQLAKRIYYSSWQSLASKGTTRLYKPKELLFLSGQTNWAAIAGKDIRLFFRDPAQWSQFAIFFGIIGVYILNIRQMNYNIDSIFWKNLISYLNLGAITLTLGTLCTRFVFPQWSIECRRMWILGMMPVSPGKVLIIKFLLSAALGLGITIPLMIISNIMIELPPYMVWLSLGTLLIMGLVLPGLALGIGAIFPNYKEDDLAKIVAGFGGTLTLVLSLMYIFIVLALEVVPIHLYFTKEMITRAVFINWMLFSGSAIIGLSIIVGVAPLLIGWRLARKAEY